MIPGAEEGTKIDATENLKIALVSISGGGKSRLAATAPSPVYDFDFDGRKNSLSGLTGVFTKTYQDQSSSKPKAWLEFEKDLSIFEQMKAEGKPIPSTFVFDSVQYGCLAAMNYSLSMNPSARIQTTVGATTFYTPKSWDAYKLEYNAVKDNISRLFALGNVIACFHEAPEEAPDSTPQDQKYTGKQTVFPVRMEKLLPLFNEKWRITIENGQRVLNTNADDFRFTAGTTLDIPGRVVNPNIMQLIEMHRKKKAGIKV